MSFAILCTLMMSQIAYTQVYLTPLDPQINLKEIPDNVKIKNLSPRPFYLHPKDRDQILDKIFPGQLEDFDDVDRDILYKSILEYSKDKLIKKYPFIHEKNYQKIKDAFK